MVDTREIPRPAGKEVLLMATCLCDAFFDDVAKATVEVLEHVGCKVIFPEDQTCCGQPPFNAGNFEASRLMVRHNLRVFAGERPIVVPSGSCAAMCFHGAPLEFETEEDLEQVQRMGQRTWELADYLVNGLGINSWNGTLQKRIAFHHSCHTSDRIRRATVEYISSMPPHNGTIRTEMTSILPDTRNLIPVTIPLQER